MEERAVEVTKSLWNWGVVKAGSGVSALTAEVSALTSDKPSSKA